MTGIYIVILLIIFKLAKDYAYYLEEDDKYITSVDDFYKYRDRYEGGDLYGAYMNLCDADKVFIRDLMCYELLKYKENRPSFKKTCRSASKQIIGSSVLTSLIMSSPLPKAIGQNSLGYFVSNIL